MNIFNDFKLEEKVSEDTIRKYEGVLPEEIISFWKEYGFGTFLNGYLRSVNPDDYEEVFKNSVLKDCQDAIVLFTTGMSDLITWNGQALCICNYRYARIEMLTTKIPLFYRYLEDDFFLFKKLFMTHYEPAIEKYGELAYDEAFGYVPMLVLGGAETVDNLDKVKIQEHIMVFSALADPIYFGENPYNL